MKRLRSLVNSIKKLFKRSEMQGQYKTKEETIKKPAAHEDNNISICGEYAGFIDRINPSIAGIDLEAEEKKVEKEKQKIIKNKSCVIKRKATKREIRKFKILNKIKDLNIIKNRTRRKKTKIKLSKRVDSLHQAYNDI